MTWIYQTIRIIRFNYQKGKNFFVKEIFKNPEFESLSFEVIHDPEFKDEVPQEKNLKYQQEISNHEIFSALHL